MNRRHFLLAGAAALVGSTVVGHVLSKRQLEAFATLDITPRLQALKGQTLRSTGTWLPAQIFTHLAQSIEFSLTGYPQAKPAWFQHTVGAAAFAAFSVAGAMRHNLAEPIPGAPTLDGITDTDTDAALDRLLAALQQFDAHHASLAEHFAYGQLDARQYRAAHLMHIENHLREVLV
ncbi:DUF1569 domain-containing protein [Permianibacter sp. IMCC34836]|uniref:DUF1569 domain-containing protein n=1 Tax=Permianibacter fluminis TaxID=2738515 RepID=UPI0015518CE3|nr:DUF1569 domain-containing protein [Permianibacter fluminis]NQD36547.1 DUF1569 domain-containing protein [Permianibacter fluminis]